MPINKENRIKTLQTILSLDESEIYTGISDDQYCHLIDEKYCYCTIGHILNKNYNIITPAEFYTLDWFMICDMLDLTDSEMREIIHRNDKNDLAGVKEFSKILLDAEL